MQQSNAQVLHHFYSLLLEMNFHESENEKPTAAEIEDPFVRTHLRRIRLKIAKNKAELKKRTYHLLVEEVERIRKIGFEELTKLLTPREALQLQPLFSKFESLSEKDRKSIAEDEELLNLLSALKDKLDKPNHS